MSGYKYITGVQLSLPLLVIVFNGPVMTTSGAAFFFCKCTISFCLSFLLFRRAYLKLCYIKGFGILSLCNFIREHQLYGAVYVIMITSL